MIEPLERKVWADPATAKKRIAELEAENAKLEYKVARVGAINEKVNIKFNSRGRELDKLRALAQAVVESKRGMGHLIPSSVGWAIDVLAALLEEGGDE